MLIALLEIGAIFVLVVANGVLAGTEIAVISSRKSRLGRRSEAGDDGATRALRLLRSPNRFLSTVQVGITAVAVAGGLFGGVRIATTLSALLVQLGVGPEAARVTALALVFVLITFLMLVLGELVPKRIALRYPEEIASRLSRPMDRLSAAASPLVGLLSASTEFILRVLPLPPPSREEVTEEEIQAMIAQATETGVLEATEQEIVGHLFRLSDQTVERVMTPRDRIVWLDVNDGPERWRDALGEVLHTRYLVCDGSLDRVLGHVKVQDLLRRCTAGRPLEIQTALRESHRVPEWMPAFRLLELFQWSGRHIGVVMGRDERVAGLVTLHDVVEGIVGEIRLQEIDEPEVIRREDGTFLVDGLLPFQEFLTVFELEVEVEVEQSEETSWGTVHSFVVATLESEPRTAAVIEWKGLRIEVVDMDGRRVDKVLVSG